MTKKGRRKGDALLLRDPSKNKGLKQKTNEYEQRNEFNFNFLQSTNELTKSYGVTGVPAFFILDEKRVIRNVISGYSKENTDEALIESIENL